MNKKTKKKLTTFTEEYLLPSFGADVDRVVMHFQKELDSIHEKIDFLSGRHDMLEIAVEDVRNNR